LGGIVERVGGRATKKIKPVHGGKTLAVGGGLYAVVVERRLTAKIRTGAK